MPHLPSVNGCQYYLAGSYLWDNLILLLQMSYERSYPYPWHCSCQYFPNMQTECSFHRMCAPKYVRLVLTVPLLDMQILVLPIHHGAHTLPKTSFSVRWYMMSPPPLTTSPVCLYYRVEGKGNHKFWSFWKMWRHSLKIVELLVAFPIALVQYTPQQAKYNKIQSFTSLPPLDAVERLLSYVTICLAIP